VFSERLREPRSRSPSRTRGSGQIAAAAWRSPSEARADVTHRGADTIAPLMNDKVQYDPRKTSCRSRVVAVMPVWLVVNAALA